MLKASQVSDHLMSAWCSFYNSINEENIEYDKDELALDKEVFIAGTKTNIKNYSFIAGGAIASLFLEQEINDYDTYFTNKAAALQLINLFRAHAADQIQVHTSKALLLKNKFQLISLVFGEPQNVINKFDFLHTHTYWNPRTLSKLFMEEEVFAAIENKTLIYMGSNYPLIALKRVDKFIQRGWTIEDSELKKITDQLKEYYVESKEEKLEYPNNYLINEDLQPFKFLAKAEPLRKKLEWMEEVIEHANKREFGLIANVKGLY